MSASSKFRIPGNPFLRLPTPPLPPAHRSSVVLALDTSFVCAVHEFVREFVSWGSWQA